MQIDELIAQHPDIIRERFGDVTTITFDQAWDLYNWTCRNVGYPKKKVDDDLIRWAEELAMALYVPEKQPDRVHCAMCSNWIYDCGSDRIQMVTPMGVGYICNDCLKRYMNGSRK